MYIVYIIIGTLISIVAVVSIAYIWYRVNNKAIDTRYDALMDLERFKFNENYKCMMTESLNDSLKVQLIMAKRLSDMRYAYDIKDVETKEEFENIEKNYIEDLNNRKYKITQEYEKDIHKLLIGAKNGKN